MKENPVYEQRTTVEGRGSAGLPWEKKILGMGIDLGFTNGFVCLGEVKAEMEKRGRRKREI